MNINFCSSSCESHHSVSAGYFPIITENTKVEEVVVSFAATVFPFKLFYNKSKFIVKGEKRVCFTFIPFARLKFFLAKWGNEMRFERKSDWQSSMNLIIKQFGQFDNRQILSKVRVCNSAIKNIKQRRLFRITADGRAFNAFVWRRMMKNKKPATATKKTKTKKNEKDELRGISIIWSSRPLFIWYLFPWTSFGFYDARHRMC